MRIGVLALQGAVSEHLNVLNELGVEAVSVRLPSELHALSALIIPGGESTTISKLLTDYQLIEPLTKLVQDGFPVFGTCAGLVILGKLTNGAYPKTLGVLDVEVERNAFGRQVDSFESELTIPVLGTKPFHGVFIRAPIIERVGSDVEVLCKINDSTVAVREGRVLACAFHPELTDDLRFHQYFLHVITGDSFAKSDH